MKLPTKIPGTNLYPTLNARGFAIEPDDEYSKAFIEFCKTVKKPVLDIGVAYGFSTLAALKQGAEVVANDLDQRHLNILYQHTPKKLRDRLVLAAGAFPQDLEYKAETFDAVHAARIFHFLMPEEITLGIQKIAKWLKPNGKVFITSGTAYMKIFLKFIPLYEQRIKQGDPWPGMINNFRDDYCPLEFRQHAALKMNMLDPTVLRRICEQESLIVEKCDFFPRNNFLENKLDDREGVGIIARKPD